jgi:hypothetical protein
MRRLKLLLVFTFLLISGLFAQTNNFEGKIVLKVKTGQSENRMNYLIKGNSVRMEMPQMPMGYMLMKDSSFYVVMPQQKMYMTIDAKQKSMMGNDPLQNLSDSQKPTATGKTKKINGYNCKEYIINNESGKTTIWATDEFINFPGFAGSSDDNMKKALGMERFFPMIVIANENGVNVRMEVESIKEESISDDMFALPKDFNEMKMPGQ